MPVERIVAYFNENGFSSDKQTAHGLLKKTADLFENLHKTMRFPVKEDNYLCCDETYHRVFVSKSENESQREPIITDFGKLFIAACTES